MKRFPEVLMTLAGGMDAVTGLCLILAPGFTLRLMRIGEIPEALQDMRFVGAFVFATGSAYLLPWLARAADTRRRRFAAALWFTRWVRVCIACFSSVALVAGWLHPTWITVPLTDATLAVVQTLMIRKRVFGDV